MKKLFLLAAVATLVSFYAPVEPLSKKERKLAVSNLKASKQDLIKAVKGLSEEQLNFKPAEDKWSVKECVYHIALSEANLRQWIDGTVKAPANPEKKADIKVTDDQVMKGISDRSNKVKTFEALEPKSAKWSTMEEALKDFGTNRESLIDYVKTTQDDLRGHITPQTPMGPLDAYQLILFLSSHSTRHILQINEVKADPGFPKQ